MIHFDNSKTAVELLNSIIYLAVERKASDVHFRPQEGCIEICFRVNGLLQKIDELDSRWHEGLLGRIKVLCRLRMDEHFDAQDGSFKFGLKDSRQIEVRASIVPTVYGQNAILRLLAAEDGAWPLEQLGFNKMDLSKVVQSLERKQGMVLVTGPTGSGKTTTLYSAMKYLNSGTAAIVSIEDPVEYAVKGTQQINLSQNSKLNFSNALRSVLRQDPDIIMVGEIRDKETARLAVNSALTGHLLLSTLHTNNTISSLFRLWDLGVESYLIASTVKLVIAQRLMSRLCSECKIRKNLSESEKLVILDVFSRYPYINFGSNFFTNHGCPKCFYSGFSGRVGVYEVLSVTERVAQAFLNRMPYRELLSLAKEEGMVSIADLAWQKAVEGQVSINEVIKNLYD